jgi:hypothetical protein
MATETVIVDETDHPGPGLNLDVAMSDQRQSERPSRKTCQSLVAVMGDELLMQMRSGHLFAWDSGIVVARSEQVDLSGNLGRGRTESEIFACPERTKLT